ncbi:MAG: hypothetical protein M3475_05510 [Actinomycetota bacterium]|nr:hypothetical protein [Actinomycetota bacterium]
MKDSFFTIFAASLAGEPLKLLNEIHETVEASDYEEKQAGGLHPFA